MVLYIYILSLIRDGVQGGHGPPRSKVAIWRARNQAIFEGQETNPLKLCQKVDKTIVEHRRSMAIHSGLQLLKPIQRWKKPPRDSIKINVDAAFKDGSSSIAVVARDCKGEVVFISREGKWYLPVLRKYIPTSLSRQQHKPLNGS